MKKKKKKGYQMGECPICKSINLEYEAVELEGECLYYPVECNDCGAIGREYYNVEFTDIEMEK